MATVGKMEFRDVQAKGLREAGKVERCCYIKPSGHRCGSPAMRGYDLCYYHDRYQPKPEYRNLPCLEDAHSVQCAIQEVIEDMLRGFLDYKKAALALYGLQTAASNLKQMRLAEKDRLEREEEACTVDRAPCTEEERAQFTVDGSQQDQPCTVNREPCTEEMTAVKASREATAGCSPARSAGYEVKNSGESRRDDWNRAIEDDVEEIELTLDPEQRSTDNGPRSTPFLESPRPPQRVTQGGLTRPEREARDAHLPDLDQVRSEIFDEANANSAVTPAAGALI